MKKFFREIFSSEVNYQTQNIPNTYYHPSTIVINPIQPNQNPQISVIQRGPCIAGPQNNIAGK
jgi:hypothetical protein